VNGYGDRDAAAVHFGTPTKYTICHIGMNGNPNA
jgi:hypothetical protein